MVSSTFTNAHQNTAFLHLQYCWPKSTAATAHSRLHTCLSHHRTGPPHQGALPFKCLTFSILVGEGISCTHCAEFLINYRIESLQVHQIYSMHNDICLNSYNLKPVRLGLQVLKRYARRQARPTSYTYNVHCLGSHILLVYSPTTIPSVPLLPRIIDIIPTCN